MLRSGDEAIDICFDPETYLETSHTPAPKRMLPQIVADELEAWDTAWVEDCRALWLSEALDFDGAVPMAQILHLKMSTEAICNVSVDTGV